MHRFYQTPAGASVWIDALAVYAWPEGSERYRRLDNFVKKFFDSIDKFQTGSYHPRWKEINLAAEVPGWTRFKAAQAWLDAHKVKGAADAGGLGGDTAAIRAAFEQFLNKQAKAKGRALSSAERDELAASFEEWWKSKTTVTGR